MNPRALLAAAVLALVVLCAPAHAAQPFLPGEQASIRLATQVWHPSCDHVGVEAMTQATKDQVKAQLGGEGQAFGVTPSAVPCSMQINWPLIKRYADDELFNWKGRVRLRNEKVYVCAVIVHEMGHVAGFYDPVGAPEWNLQGQPIMDPDTGQQARDHQHSPDPRSIMYPYSNGTYWRCRHLFPMPHGGVGRRPLPDSAPAQKTAVDRVA